jgi:hypothetical protein
MEARFWRVWEIHSKVIRLFDGYWIWLRVSDKITNPISGKYLFFSEDKNKLLEIATSEIENHGFEMAKVNENLLEGQTEHVLCLYYEDDSRKDELAERNKQDYGVKYRYWKSDADTLKGKYSKEFLDKLPEEEKRHFTSQKTLIEFKDTKGITILKQSLKRKYERKKRV